MAIGNGNQSNERRFQEVFSITDGYCETIIIASLGSCLKTEKTEGN